MTDLDQRIHEDLERLTALAPVPPSVADITARRPTVERHRRPVVLGLAAAAVIVVAVVGAVVLLNAAGDGDDRPAVAPPTTVARPDLAVFMDPDATEAQIAAIAERLHGAAEVVDVVFVDHDGAYGEFQDLYGDDPALIESVTPEMLPTSFRVTLVDHDLTAAQGLITELQESPGVREVQAEPVLDPPEQVPNDVVLPRLVIDLPGWSDPTVVSDGLDEPPVDGGPQLVVYQGIDGWLPLVSVLTTTSDYGLGSGNRTIEIAGHQAQVSPRSGSTQVIGWHEGGETVALTGFGVAEDDLIAAAQTLVPAPDGRFEIASPPPGMTEVFRTDGPSRSASRTVDITYRSDDGQDIELHQSTNGEDGFWESVTDVLFGAPSAEDISVRGTRGVFTGSSGEYRVDWLDRQGSVAMRIDLCCDLRRGEALTIVEHLVEVDLATWRQLTGTATDVAPTTTACAATSDTLPDPCSTGDGTD